MLVLGLYDLVPRPGRAPPPYTIASFELASRRVKKVVKITRDYPPQDLNRDHTPRHLYTMIFTAQPLAQQQATSQLLLICSLIPICKVV
uniref:Uncharacterized protein n=1 Tax=Agaricus bisporus TaxID=5341 RepID=A0A1Q1M961_AGABI|nr:hypothetical protein [Agaricus bisporus]